MINEMIEKWYRTNEDEVVSLADKIWAKPEASLEEFQACANVADFLEKQGFRVQTFHCCDENQQPNTVVAEWGNGTPVIGILGEYDALLGLGQDATPYHSPKSGYGHGCGHNLMCPACASAASAAKEAMKTEKRSGTIRFIACPAEEVGVGKLDLMKKGVFDGLECCMAWHPAGYDLTPFEGVLQALTVLKFDFFGEPAHAALSPELGRSALDAAELLNIGVQFLREHVTSDVRIHYVFLNGGDRPNIVPAYASLQYYVRAKDELSCKGVVERVRRIAEGAAIMTDTKMSMETQIESSETCIIHSFNRFLFETAKKVPLIEYTREEKEFAAVLYRNILGKEPEEEILPGGLKEPTGHDIPAMGSTDVGRVTKMIPTARLFGLGILKDIPTHHWGVTASVGMSIGHKAALFAGQALAQAAYEISCRPDQIAVWRKELESKK